MYKSGQHTNIQEWPKWPGSTRWTRWTRSTRRSQGRNWKSGRDGGTTWWHLERQKRDHEAFERICIDEGRWWSQFVKVEMIMFQNKRFIWVSSEGLPPRRRGWRDNQDQHRQQGEISYQEKIKVENMRAGTVWPRRELGWGDSSHQQQ